MNDRRFMERLFAASAVSAALLALGAGFLLLAGFYLFALALASLAALAWSGTVAACAKWRRS